MLPVDASSPRGDATNGQSAQLSTIDRLDSQPKMASLDMGTAEPRPTRPDAVPSRMRDRFLREAGDLPPNGQQYQQDSSSRLTMPMISPAQLAFSAMQFLPVPLLVLNGLKTVVLANDAMVQLLGIGKGKDDGQQQDTTSIMNTLRGQSLSQVGVDLMQGGRPVWVTWEALLDSLVDQTDVSTPGISSTTAADSAGDTTPRAESAGERAPSTSEIIHSTVLDVVILKKALGGDHDALRSKSRGAECPTYAKMLITVWEVDEHQTYFTLTFTHSNTSETSAITQPSKSVARVDVLEAAECRSIPHSNASSLSSGQGSVSPSFRVSPGVVTMSSSPFPPMGPPAEAPLSSSPSFLQKTLLMKNALIDNTETVIFAMWKDGSVMYPNSAARRLFRKGAVFDEFQNGNDILPKWEVYDEDFTRHLDPSEYPISVLLQTEQPFTERRLGVYDASGERRIFDTMGELIRDERTGEVLAGVITGHDVTNITQKITQIKEEDDERFRLMCDTMPQFVWTANPDGLPDFFNSRWYEYTGLSKEESLGAAWIDSFHPEDRLKTMARWTHSLQTGEQYVTEYRCRNSKGQWRWFLGRALPQKNKETGEIEKWFGTCTDVHENVETELAARLYREQLLSVITHARVTIFSIDAAKRITMLEGALIWDAKERDRDHTTLDRDSQWYIGQSVDKVFGRLTARTSGEKAGFLRALDDILAGHAKESVREHVIDRRWYRTRFLPISGKGRNVRDANEMTVQGVTGVIMDVTELKASEAEVVLQEKEKRQAIASEAAAKEASRLKGQFLANMSHEIRTPITGVIGMAELLLDMDLAQEQREYIENIYRSGNALLTVINDILDFSKIESGRLDVEEVQFSLSVIVNDVNKMLSFAAERKNLDFQGYMASDIANDLVLLGDPGRVRQIITNLLTNSIKFTNHGYVRFSALKERETSEIIEVKFMVEDSGIGMDEEMRKRLFQPFSQGDASTARKFGGTGLGLTICKNLLGLMNGRIDIRSHAGSGTTATFWIPFNKPHETKGSDVVHIEPLADRLQSDMSVSCHSSEVGQRVGTPPTERPQTSLGGVRSSPMRKTNPAMGALSQPNEDEMSAQERGKIHVLIVEDNAINQQIAIKTIEKLGFNVTAAWNGKEALEYLDSARDGTRVKPHIILMDVQMPIIDGYKCTHVLRYHLPYKDYVREIPIVAMTASAIQGDKVKCVKAGMDDYLAKPVKSHTLERMLVHWTKPKRPGLMPHQDSEASDCSDVAHGCSNPSIPVLEYADPLQDINKSSSSLQDEFEAMRQGETPKPPVHRPIHELPQKDYGFLSTGPDFTRPVQRRETDERALHSRDDKLMDVANGGALPTPHCHSLPQEGEALTTANVAKLQRQESMRRQST